MKFRFLFPVALLMIFFFNSCRNNDEPILTYSTEDINYSDASNNILNNKITFTHSDNDRQYIKSSLINGSVNTETPTTDMDITYKAYNNNPYGAPYNIQTISLKHTLPKPTSLVKIENLELQPKIFVGRNDFPVQKLEIIYTFNLTDGSKKVITALKNY